MSPSRTRCVPYPVPTTTRVEPVMVEQVVQIVGALLVLAGFLLAQFDVLDQRSYAYLLPNAVGSAAMAVTAVLTREWGFLFLEGVWTLVSLWGLLERLRTPAPRAEGQR